MADSPQGQIPWPPPGTSRDRYRAGFMSASGQKPLALDSPSTQERHVSSEILGCSIPPIAIVGEVPRTRGDSSSSAPGTPALKFHTPPHVLLQKSLSGAATMQSTRSASTNLRRMSPSLPVFDDSEPIARTKPAVPSYLTTRTSKVEARDLVVTGPRRNGSNPALKAVVVREARRRTPSGHDRQRRPQP